MIKRVLLVLTTLFWVSPVLAQGNNVWLGPNAGDSIGVGTVGADGNIGIGKDACENSGANSYAICLGYEAGKNVAGAGQIAIGAYALHNGANVFYSICGGLEACRYLTSGQYNTLWGWGIAISLITGSHNSGYGHDGLKYATSVSWATFFGKESQYRVQGSGNATFGARSMGDTTTSGNDSAFHGNYSGYRAYGSEMVGLGFEAGYDGRSRSVYIGYQAGKGFPQSEALFLRNLIYGRFDANCVVIGTQSNPPGCEAGAAVTVNSTVGGLKVPRLTNAQETAITSVSAGTIIYNTDLARLRVQVNGVWRSIALEP